MRIKIFQAVMPEFARSEVGAFASFFNGSHSRTFLVASRKLRTKLEQGIDPLSQDDPLCLPADAHLTADEFDGTSCILGCISGRGHRARPGVNW